MCSILILIVMAAVKKNGFLLEFASAELRNDFDIVMAAVKQDGNALLLASALRSFLNFSEAYSSAEPRKYSKLKRNSK